MYETERWRREAPRSRWWCNSLSLGNVLCAGRVHVTRRSVTWTGSGGGRFRSSAATRNTRGAANFLSTVENLILIHPSSVRGVFFSRFTLPLIRLFLTSIFHYSSKLNSLKLAPLMNLTGISNLAPKVKSAGKLKSHLKIFKQLKRSIIFDYVEFPAFNCNVDSFPKTSNNT